MKWNLKGVKAFMERFRYKSAAEEWMTPERIEQLHQNFEAFKAGDIAAYDVIYHIFFTPLYNFSLDLKFDLHAASEALYAAFDGMLRNCARFRDIEQLEFYLYAMVRYKILGRLINERINLNSRLRRSKMNFHSN